MSRGDPRTRGRILRAGLQLLEEGKGSPISMAQVAARAEVSRQALYLHFADRTDLLLEVTRLADATYRTPDRQRQIDDAPTAREALRRAVELQAYLKPRLYAMTIALSVLRRSDDAAEAAWQERDGARLGRCRAVANRLHDEEQLRTEIDPETAACLIWTATSPGTWEDIVRGQGWSSTRWVQTTVEFLEAGLLR